MPRRSCGAALGGEAWPVGDGRPVALAELGELAVGGECPAAGYAVEAPGGSAFFAGVDVFLAGCEPSGPLKSHQDRIEGAAGLADEAHEFESVAWLLGVFKEDLDDCGHLGREVEIFGRRFHAPIVATST